MGLVLSFSNFEITTKCDAQTRGSILTLQCFKDKVTVSGAKMFNATGEWSGPGKLSCDDLKRNCAGNSTI